VKIHEHDGLLKHIYAQKFFPKAVSIKLIVYVNLIVTG